MNLLCKLNGKTLHFLGTDFSGIEFKQANFAEIKFQQCNFQNCNISANQLSDKLQVIACKVKSLNQFTHIQVQEIDFRNMKISQNELNQLGSMTNLKRLSMQSMTFEEGSQIPYIENLESLKVSSVNIDGNIIKNCTNVRELGIATVPSDKIFKNSQVLKQFTSLTDITLHGIPNGQELLPEAQNLTKIVIGSAGLKEFEFVKRYPNLSQVSFPNNPIGDEQENSIIELINKLDRVEFIDTPLQQKWSSTQYQYSSEERSRRATIRNKYQRMTGDWKNTCFNSEELIEILKNDVINQCHRPLVIKELEGVQVGQISELCENTSDSIYLKLETPLQIDGNSLEGVSIQELLKLSNIIETSEIKFNVDLCSGITTEDLDLLKQTNVNFKFNVKEESLMPEYTIDEFQAIVSVMQEIKEAIPENSTELEKFLFVYKILGENIDYDNSGCDDSPLYTKEDGRMTRSLIGTLLNGNGVCAGYSLALAQVLNYVGIEAEEVSGVAHLKNGMEGRTCVE